MASISMADSWMNAEPAPRILIDVDRQPAIGDKGKIKLEIEVSVAFTGQCTLRGSPGENVGGWQIGFVQLKHTTADWAEYRGETSSNGSIFSQMGRPPARPRQLCLDFAPSIRPFYGENFTSNNPATDNECDRTFLLASNVTIPASGKLEIIIDLGDGPAREFDAALPNTQFSPAAINYIHALESRAAFITLLTAKDPQGQYHFIKHMYWNIIWQAQFRLNSSTHQITKTRQSGGVNIQRSSHSGIPNDPRFASSLREAEPGSTLHRCNTVAQAAYRDPARLRYARSWQMWNVGS